MNNFFNALIDIIGSATLFEIIEFIFILAFVCSLPSFFKGLYRG